MSKRWKIIIGSLIGVVMVGAILIGLASFVRSQNRNFRAMAGQPPRATQLDVRLLDEDEDGIPDRGVATLPGLTNLGPGVEREERFNQDAPQLGPQLEVQLIDDDGDGVPDRGVLDLPDGRPFERGFGPGQGFGRGSVPGRGAARFPGSRFGPFFIIGGLIRLIVLATVVVGAVVLGVVLFRRWGLSSVAPTISEDTPPPEAEPEATEPLPTEPDSTEVDVAEPDENQPDEEVRD